MAWPTNAPTDAVRDAEDAYEAAEAAYERVQEAVHEAETALQQAEDVPITSTLPFALCRDKWAREMVKLHDKAVELERAHSIPAGLEPGSSLPESFHRVAIMNARDEHHREWNRLHNKEERRRNLLRDDLSLKHRAASNLKRLAANAYKRMQAQREKHLLDDEGYYSWWCHKHASCELSACPHASSYPPDCRYV